MKRIPDRDLMAELDYMSRQLAECRQRGEKGQYVELTEFRQKKLQQEAARRQRLVGYGGSPLKQAPSGIRERLDKVKELVDMEALADRLRIVTLGSMKTGRLKYICPIHHDNDPSGVLYLDQKKWWCFGCSQGGDAFDLVMAVRCIEFIPAVEWLENSLGLLPLKGKGGINL